MDLFRLPGVLQRRKQFCTGVDLGSHRIKAVRLQKGADGPRLVGRAFVSTPVDIVRDGVNHPEMAAALARTLEAAGVPEEAADLVTAVGGGRVITRNILMPAMPEKELAAGLQWEAERHIPLPVQDLIIRHVDLGKEERDGVVQRHVLLVAAPRTVVDDYCALFRETGRYLLAVDMQALALWRVFCGLAPESAPAGTAAVLDIGAVHAELAVVRDGQLRYARTLPGGGEALTEALVRTLGVDAETARRIKEGENPDGRSEAAVAETERSFSLQVGLIELVREIRRSLDWYQTQNREQPVARIILSGGGSKVSGLPDYLTEQLGLPVAPGCPC
ncbi:MAG: type IV pilus assembly protein PilM, partial [Candidatus Desulforudis sp.]|nr:type IV pilus assembly protein PilM [Desulforudis sp.]